MWPNKKPCLNAGLFLNRAIYLRNTSTLPVSISTHSSDLHYKMIRARLYNLFNIPVYSLLAILAQSVITSKAVSCVTLLYLLNDMPLFWIVD